MNEHILKIGKYVCSAMMGIFSFLIAIVGIVKETHKLNADDTAEALSADSGSSNLLEDD